VTKIVFLKEIRCSERVNLLSPLNQKLRHKSSDLGIFPNIALTKAMASMSLLDQYLGAIYQCDQSRNGPNFANLVALPVPSLDIDQNNMVLAEQVSSTQNIDNYCSRMGLPSGLDIVSSARLQCLAALWKQDYDDSYKHQKRCYDTILDMLSTNNEEFAYMVPAFVRITDDLRKVAMIADRNKPERERLSDPSLRDAQVSSIAIVTLLML
jgi:hypothetical protein